MGYFAALNAIYLLSFDLTMTRIGVLAGIATIPFVLKIFLGILSDKVPLYRFGHRKPYIILGLAVQTFALFIVPWVDPGQNFWSFAGLAFTALLGLALYDTCTDGLALDTTPKHEEGAIQSFMVGGRALGMVLGSALLGTVAEYTHWRWAFWLLGLLGFLPLPMLFRFKEPERLSGSSFEWTAFRSMLHGKVLYLGLMGAILASAIYAAEGIVNPFLKTEYDINHMQAGLFGATWGLGVVAGGVIGGYMNDRRRRESTLRLGIISAIITTLSLACIPNVSTAWILVVLFGAAFGYFETVYCAISMDVSDRRIAASMFAVLMAVGNIGVGLGLFVGCRLVDIIDYRWTFCLIAMVNLAAIPLVSRTCRPVPANRQPESHGIS